MPVALERKLRRQANKNPNIKDKDAYVYGTLRETGWKPRREREKERKMSERLDDLIHFRAGIAAVPYGAITDPEGNVHSITYRDASLPGAGEHFKRHAGAYIGGAAGAAGLVAADAVSHIRTLSPAAGFKKLAGAGIKKALTREKLIPSVVGGAGVGGLIGGIIDQGRRRRALREESLERAPYDAQRIGQAYRKRKLINDGIPGSSPGSPPSELSAKLDHLIEFVYPIHIKKSHEGKFDELKERTGKTTAQLLHSKSKKVREEANFAKVAKKWHHPRFSNPDRLIQFSFEEAEANLAREMERIHMKHQYRRMAPKVVPEGTLQAPNQPAMGEDERGNLLKRLRAIRRRGGGYYPERSDVARGLSSKLDHLIQFGDPRPRNPLGEFTGSSGGEPTPNQMATVYKPPSYSQVATTAAVGGAAGAMGVGAGGLAFKKIIEAIKKRKKV